MELQVKSTTGGTSIGPLLGGLDFGESAPVTGQPDFSSLLEEALGKLPLSSQGLALGHVRQVFSELLSQMDRKELVAYLASLPEAERARLSQMPEPEWQGLLKQAGLPIDEQVPLKGLFEEAKQQAASLEEAELEMPVETQLVTVAPMPEVPVVNDPPVVLDTAAPDAPPPADDPDRDGQPAAFFRSEPDSDRSLAPAAPLADPAITAGALVTSALPETTPLASQSPEVSPMAQVVTVPEWAVPDDTQTGLAASPLPQADPEAAQPAASQLQPVAQTETDELTDVNLPAQVTQAPQPSQAEAPKLGPQVKAAVQGVKTEVKGEVAQAPKQPVLKVPEQPADPQPSQAEAPKLGPQVKAAVEEVKTEVKGEVAQAPQQPVLKTPEQPADPQPSQAEAPKLGPQVKAAVEAVKTEVKGEVAQAPQQQVLKAPEQPADPQPSQAEAPKLRPQVKAAVEAVKTEVKNKVAQIPLAQVPQQPAVRSQAEAPKLGLQVKAAVQAVKAEVKGGDGPSPLATAPHQPVLETSAQPKPQVEAPKLRPQVKAAVHPINADHPAPAQRPVVTHHQPAPVAEGDTEVPLEDRQPEETAQVPEAPRDLTGFIPAAPPPQPGMVAIVEPQVEAIAPTNSLNSRSQPDLTGDGMPQPMTPTAPMAAAEAEAPETPEAPVANPALTVELEAEVADGPALPPTLTVLQTINQGTPVHFSQVPVIVQEVIELVPMQVGNTTQIEVRLDPPQVGPIKVTFTMNAPQQMGVLIETMTQTAQRVMEAYVPRMQQTVQNNGLAMRVEPEIRLNPDAVTDAGQAKGRGDRQMGQRQRRRSGREDLTV